MAHKLLIALVAGAVLPACALGQSASPTFRANSVYVFGDTVWFLSDAWNEGSATLDAIAYVRTSRRWALVRRDWRRLAEIRQASASGGSLVNNTVGGEPPLAYGYHLVDSEPAIDPRYARSSDSAGHQMRRLELVSRSNARFPIGIRLAAAERRAIYVAAGGSRRIRAAPPFASEPTDWASGDGRIALALPAAGPPPPEAAWLPQSRDERRYDPFLSGLIVFDTATRSMTTLITPRLIERTWAGIAIAGGALWAAPLAVADSDDDVSDRPARSVAPPLARYDFTRQTWRFFRPHEIPIAFGDHPTRLVADAGHVYFVGRDGVAVLDARTLKWDARCYTDSAYTLPDGADTTVTRLTSQRVVADTTVSDTSRVLLALSGELAPRHRTAFERDLLALVPFDTLAEIADEMMTQRGGRWDTGDPFVTATARAAMTLEERRFIPYLREAMWHVATQPFASDVLRAIADSELRCALRSTLDSGTTLAAIAAADTLVGRGDPAGLTWLRSQLAPTSRIALAGPPGNGGYRPLIKVAIDLALRQDTASVDPMIALLDDPPRGVPRDEQPLIVMALDRFTGAAVRRRVAAAIAARPWLRR